MEISEAATSGQPQVHAQTIQHRMVQQISQMTQAGQQQQLSVQQTPSQLPMQPMQPQVQQTQTQSTLRVQQYPNQSQDQPQPTITQQTTPVQPGATTNPSPMPVVITKTSTPPPPSASPVSSMKSAKTQADLKSEEDTVEASWLWICDWRNCPRKKFKSLNEVYRHACLVHCPEHLDPGVEIYCQWGAGPGLCDGIPRKRFSLMTHLLDRHCTLDSFKAAVQRRLVNGIPIPTQIQPVTIIKNMAASQAQSDARGTASPALSTSSTGSLPSAASAAMHAIKRHTADFVNPKELMDENEGPVTKSIRLTAALILRNLVTHTAVAKKNVRQFEPHLASVALSNVESSGTISQILYELNN